MPFIDFWRFDVLYPQLMVVSGKSYIDNSQLDSSTPPDVGAALAAMPMLTANGGSRLILAGWAPRAHPVADSAAMVGRGLPTLQTATAL